MTVSVPVYQALKALKAVENPQMRQEDVPSQKPATGWVHGDTGLVFPTRSALKKAIRICRGHNNCRPLHQRNRERFNGAIRRIIANEGMDLRAMMQDVMRGYVTKFFPENKFKAFIEDTIKTVVAEQLGFKKDNSYRSSPQMRKEPTAQFREWVDGIVKKEAAKLVLESLSFDIAIRGSAVQPATRTRALALEHLEEKDEPSV